MTATPTKPRIDSWDAALDEAQRWETYTRFRRYPWQKVAMWVAKEYSIAPPSRTALYRWGARMRKLESAHRIEQAVTARAEAAQLAGEAGQDDAVSIEAYKTLAADLALRTGDAKAAGSFLKMALALAESRSKAQELSLKARAQAMKEEALTLMRDRDTAQARIAELEAALENSGKSHLADPAAVAAELDRHLGVKK